MKNGKILVVDDEPAERDGLARLVGQWGYDVETASSGEEALNLIESQHPAVVLTDLVLPEMDGLTLLQKLKETGRPPIVLLVTGHGTVDSAVEAMRHGAFDYLTKPVDATRLQALLEKSIEQESLSREVNFLRHQLRQKGSFGQLVGQSRTMQEVYRWIELAATSTAPVLVYGESGTGKELVARTVHDLSNRRNRPFVAINCAAIPETLIESELFGHERGAFTGATERRLGCFELADGGTLFLDEIANIRVEQQARLLRVLEDGCFERLGSSRTQQTDVRVLAATNANIETEVEAGRFRSDLLYRLNTIHIHLPPLRERGDDIVRLAQRFLERHTQRHRRGVERFTDAALSALRRYAWPGNVRELSHVIERAVLMSRGASIGPADLRLDAAPAQRKAMTLDAIEQEAIRAALARHDDNVSAAADELGLSRQALYRRLGKADGSAHKADASEGASEAPVRPASTGRSEPDESM